MTPQTIITAALRHLGVVGAADIPNGSDSTLCLDSLKSMLDAWNLDPQAVVGLQELTHTPVAGAQSFTIGPAGDVVARQPVRIDKAVYRQGSTDWPVDVIEVADYAGLSLKANQSSPCSIALNRGTDTATVYVYPAADGTSQLRMWVQKDVVTSFDTLALVTTIVLPNGCQNALEWNLAEEVSGMFGVPDRILANVVRKANSSLRRFKRSNVRVPQLDMARGTQYDATSDRWV